MKIKNIVTVLLVAIILVSCAPAAIVVPTETIMLTSAFTPIPPTPTITPTIPPPLTETPEVKFQICTIEQYIGCEIKSDDLISGKYLEWLNTLSKPFDTSVIKDEAITYYDGRYISYHAQSAPHFMVDGTAPFRRDVTFGNTTFQGHEYIVMPIEYFDKNNPNKNPWVITVYDKTGESPEQTLENIRIWKEDMNITLIGVDDVPFYGTAASPLITLTESKYPNLLDLINNFVNFGTGGVRPGDRSALSLPGLILPSYILYEPKGWFR